MSFGWEEWFGLRRQHAGEMLARDMVEFILNLRNLSFSSHIEAKKRYICCLSTLSVLCMFSGIKFELLDMCDTGADPRISFKKIKVGVRGCCCKYFGVLITIIFECPETLESGP